MAEIQTQNLAQGVVHPANLQIYNGLDCMLTLEIFEELSKQFNQEPISYQFALALQAPILEIMLRGFCIDETERQTGIRRLKAQLVVLDGILQTLAHAVWDKPLNPRSPKQLIDFFYGCMKLPEIWTSKKGVKKLSLDRDTLEKLEVYFHARPIISTILAYRDVAKQLSVLETEVSSDGRLRTSYNIAGTETGRLSSSGSADGTGSNLQNVAPHLRRMFIADPGMKLCVIDLEQAESREVGWLCGTLFNDWRYLDACYAGDLHTTTCKLIWTKLPWTGNPKEDRAIADRNFYREYSHRDMSKRGSHGANYHGSPFTMARHLKVPVKLMEDFQKAYFQAFPAIPRWHQWVATQLQTVGYLVTPFERKRHFFGRANDDTTLREAIAYSPQSSTADRTNLALWRIWKYFGSRVQLLAQTHDSVSFQYSENDNEAEIITKALSLMQVDIHWKDKTLIVPGEAKVGWNWASGGDKNPDGLQKWKGHDSRKRLMGLDRVYS